MLPFPNCWECRQSRSQSRVEKDGVPKSLVQSVISVIYFIVIILYVLILGIHFRYLRLVLGVFPGLLS